MSKKTKRDLTGRNNPNIALLINHFNEGKSITIHECWQMFELGSWHLAQLKKQMNLKTKAVKTKKGFRTSYIQKYYK